MTEPCPHGPHLLDGNYTCLGCGVRWTHQQVTDAINAPGGEYPGQPVYEAGAPTDTRELSIPAAAVEAARVVFENDSTVDDMTEGLYECMEGSVEAAAPMVVAAELRRQASRLRAFEAIGEKAPNQLAVKTLRTVAEGLEARADELDPPR